jgi:hypothetical protein
MTTRKNRKPNPEGALSRLQEMAETPYETELEGFILKNFDTIISLKTRGYAVPGIVQVLREEGYAASAPTVHAALNRAATLLGKVNPYKRIDTTQNQGESEQNQGESETNGQVLPESSKTSKLAY